MIYHVQLNQSEGPVFAYLGMELDVEKTMHWLGAAVVLTVGAGLFEWVRRGFVHRWGLIQAAIEADIRRREAA